MKPGDTGLTRIRKATADSMAGLKAAWRHESAFRQETTRNSPSIGDPHRTRLRRRQRSTSASSKRRQCRASRAPDAACGSRNMGRRYGRHVSEK